MTFAKFLVPIVALSILSGCGISESRINPANWFGDSAEEETVDATPITDPFVSVPLIPRVKSVVIEDTPGGAIVRAVGLPPTQGWFNAELVSESGGRPVDGVLTFAFVAIPPLTPGDVSTEQSREIVVGRFVSNRTLADTREIRIVAGENSQVSRR